MAAQTRNGIFCALGLSTGSLAPLSRARVPEEPLNRAVPTYWCISGSGARSSWACLHPVLTAGAGPPQARLQATVPAWRLGRAGVASRPMPEGGWGRDKQDLTWIPCGSAAPRFFGFLPAWGRRWGPSRAYCEEPLWELLVWILRLCGSPATVSADSWATGVRTRNRIPAGFRATDDLEGWSLCTHQMQFRSLVLAAPQRDWGGAASG